MTPSDIHRDPDRNVLGGPLEMCGVDPMTGFFREGACSTCPEDMGSHTVCAKVTAEFLEFSVVRLPWAEAGRPLVRLRRPLEGSI
jgi:uncharacterized protein (DUF2237 family)